MSEDKTKELTETKVTTNIEGLEQSVFNRLLWDKLNGIENAMFNMQKTILDLKDDNDLIREDIRALRKEVLRINRHLGLVPQQ